MDRKGIMGEKWLRYKVCWGFVWDLGKRDRGSVECEIEVLYDILALGVLEKMKIHPLSSNACKSTKSGVVHFALFCTVSPGAGSTRRPAALFYTYCTIVHSCIIHSVIVRFIVLLLCAWHAIRIVYYTAYSIVFK